MDNKKPNMKGIIGTVVFHGILIVCLFIFAFTPPAAEFPEPNGILVNFGELVAGEEAASPESQTNPQPEQKSDESTPNESASENAVTQNSVESIAIKASDKLSDKTPTLTAEEQEKIRKQEEFKQQQQNLLHKNLSGKPGNSENGANSGDPGNPNGDKNAKNVKGSPGNPLGNKDAQYLAKPLNTLNCNKPIELTVKIDSRGNVIAISDIETALSESSCIEAAKRAAMQNRFSSDSREVRYAKITYDYTISAK